MFKKGEAIFLAFCLIVLSTQILAAGVNDKPLSISASVGQTCSITTTSALAFGVYDPVGTNSTTPLNATGQISVACSKGASTLTIGMGDGSHFNGTLRQMIGATSNNLLPYGIFQPPSNVENTSCTFPGVIAWNNSAGIMIIAPATANTARVYFVCGTIPAAQDVSTDTYTDIVTASINF